LRALCKLEEDVEAVQVHNFLGRKKQMSNDVLIEPKFRAKPGRTFVLPHTSNLLTMTDVDTFSRDILGPPADMK
jgi:hypothetical protein